MYFKEKSIEEWQKILMGLKSLSNETAENKERADDKKFLDNSIAGLESILEGRTTKIRNIERVLNLLNQHDYYDIKSGLEMLKGVNCLDLSLLSEKVEEVSKKSGLTGIVLYSKDDEKYKERTTFINKGGYQRYFFMNHSYFNENIDLLSNGEDRVDVTFANNNFIEDARRFDWDERDYNYRLLWTTNFNLGWEELPSKSTLDAIDFELESKKQFTKIIESLRPYRRKGRVQIILSNPNQIFECQEGDYDDWTNTLNGAYFNTIRTDGTILNNKGGVFWPTNTISIPSPYLQVKDSNYVVLATNSAKEDKKDKEETKYETEFVSIIVGPNWFYDYVDYAIKNNSVDAKTVMDFSHCIVTEKKEPIAPNYKVEIKPTMVKTLNSMRKKF